MAAEAEAAREARAKVYKNMLEKENLQLHAGCWHPFIRKVIAADGEQKAAKALRDAAEVMSQSSSALQLRYLQVYFLSGRLTFSKCSLCTSKKFLSTS